LRETKLASHALGSINPMAAPSAEVTGVRTAFAHRFSETEGAATLKTSQ
jgi:hypothetical protein